VSNQFTEFVAIRNHKNNVTNRLQTNCILWHLDCVVDIASVSASASAISSGDLHIDEEATLMGFSNDGRERLHPDADKTKIEEQSKSPGEARHPIDDRMYMKLIPWEDIWTSLRVARIRGNGEMIEVFYDTLFKEAVFDDDGAWAMDIKNRP
jgi:hypothetical protein